METFMAGLHLFFEWLMKSSFQISVLICLIFVIRWIVGQRLGVRWRYWLWMLLLFRMVMPWAPESSVSVFTAMSKARSYLTVDDTDKAAMPLRKTEETKTIPEKLSRNEERLQIKSQPARFNGAGMVAKIYDGGENPGMIDILSWVWFIIVFCLVIFALLSNISFWRRIKVKRPLTESWILDLFEDCKEQMQVHTIVGVVVTDSIKSPALFGFIRPRLLLPEGVLERLSPKELRYVFLHELAHLKRRDIYVGWLMMFLQVLHWFNPLVWLAFRQMRAERELACDGLVLATTGTEESYSYGQTIVELLKNFSRQGYLPGVAGILEDKVQLKRRIKMIAGFRKSSYRVSVLAAGFLAVLGIVFLTNARAQEQGERESRVLAKEFVEMLVKGDFSKAAKGFDKKMSDAMPVGKLAEVWQSTTGQAGLFKQKLGVREEKFLGSDIVYVTCEFEKGPMDVKVVYDGDKKISGLWFVPTPAQVLKDYREQENQQPVDVTKRESKKLQGQSSVKVTQVILKDSFEQGAEAPAGWIKGKFVDGVEYIWDKNHGSDGTASLCLKKVTKKYFPIAQWTRKIKHETNNSKLTVAAKVKAENVTKAILDTLFLDENDKWIKHEWVSYIGQKKEENIPPANHDWKTYSGMVEIPENTKTIVIGLQIYGPGKVWFDDLEVAYLEETDKPSETIRKSRPFKRTTSRPSTREELSNDDGSSEGSKSIAGSGHVMKFEAPVEGCILKSVRIYGSRYGYSRPPKEDFHVYLCDENFEVIEDFPFPYSRFRKGDKDGKPRGWVKLNIKPMRVPSTFYVCLDFNPEQTKGVYVHYDGEGTGNSYIAVPGQQLKEFDRGEWMIRAIIGRPVEQSTKEGEITLTEDDSAKKSLQEIVNAAKSGSTVVVPEGVYTEPLIVTKPLTLKGESKVGCIFEVTGDKPAIFIDTKSRGTVKIENITIKWQLASSDKNIEYPFALAIKDTKAQVSNCNFVPLGNFKRSPVALQILGFSDVDIKASRFEGFALAVFYNEGTKGSIRDSLIVNCQSQGITIFQGAIVDIIGNIITGSKKHAVRNTGGTLRMQDNLIINNANRGVYLGNKSANGSISNNIIMGNGTGISGFARSRVTIENNLILDSGYAAISMRQSCSLKIRDNIFQGNERGWIMFEEDGKGGNTVYRNTFWKNKVDAENFQKTGNSILADPEFVDAANGDFSLKPGPALEYKQGLTNPEIFKKLWTQWQNYVEE